MSIIEAELHNKKFELYTTGVGAIDTKIDIPTGLMGASPRLMSVREFSKKVESDELRRKSRKSKRSVYSKPEFESDE